MAPGMGLLLFTTFSSTCDHRRIRAARTLCYGATHSSIVMNGEGRGPNDVHVVGRNASQSKPAEFVVFLVKDKGAPALVPEN